MPRRIVRRRVVRPVVRRGRWVTWAVIIAVLIAGIIICRACGFWGRIF